MCDANRPAKIEDKLVATKFHNSITRGFAAVGQPNVAVCLLPGTEIAFDESVECEPSFGIASCRTRKLGSGSRASGKSIWTTPWPITMRWNFPTGRWY